MRILAVDTSTRTGSVALAQDRELLAECSVKVNRGHAGRLLPTLDHLLSSMGWKIGDIELIACATGPGSFAALRVGISTVKGLAFATGARTIGVNTLEAMARPYLFGSLPVCPILDAKKEQVYAALFSKDGQGNSGRMTDDRLLEPENLGDLIDGQALVLGDGAIRYRSSIEKIFKNRVLFLPESVCYHRAGVVAALGLEGIQMGGRDTRLIPNYMRQPDAVVAEKRLERRLNGHCG